VPVVVAAAGDGEGVDVAVRVHAARPVDEPELEVAAPRRLQAGGELDGAQADVEACLARHRLDHLADLAKVRLVRHRQLDRERRGHAGLAQQGAGALDIARLGAERADVVGARRRERLDGRCVHAL
jgi:hypothetical protein